jgi:hypothetical protein
MYLYGGDLQLEGGILKGLTLSIYLYEADMHHEGGSLKGLPLSIYSISMKLTCSMREVA